MRITNAMTIFAAALTLFSAGCGDSTVNVGNDNPTGLVGGVVVDASNEMPLPGATVQVVSAAGTFTAMSDMNGVFQVKRVPAGSFIVTFSLMGYQTATFGDELGGAVGNFPVKNPTLTIGPIGLIKNDGTFNVRILDENGAPAPMVKVVGRAQVRYVDFSSGGPQAIGSVSVDGTSDMNGLVAFTGLPDYSSLGGIVSDELDVDVPPVKVMGSETYTFLGATFPFQVNHLTTNPPTIVLAGPRLGLSVIESNIDYLRTGGFFNAASAQQIGTGGPITIVFNQAIDPTTLRVVFLTDSGAMSSIQAQATPQSNLVTIMPSQPFPAGARMNLQLHAATTSGYEYDITAPFFVAPPAGSKPATVVSGALAPRVDPNQAATTLVFDLSEPIGIGRGSNSALDCVAYYEGANFDNNLGPFPGNWTVNGQTGVPSALACGFPSGTGAQIDVTLIQPMESPIPGTGLYTGFATRFAVRYDSTGTGGCSSALMSTPCQRPASGTKIHLVFSKQGPNTTVRRVNGQPVDDSIVVVIP